MSDDSSLPQNPQGIPLILPLTDLGAYTQKFTGYDMSIYNLVSQLGEAQTDFERFGGYDTLKKHLNRAQRSIDVAMVSMNSVQDHRTQTAATDPLIIHGRSANPAYNFIQGQLQECVTKAQNLRDNNLVSRFASVYFSDHCEAEDGCRIIGPQEKLAFDQNLLAISAKLHEISYALSTVREVAAGRYSVVVPKRY